MTKTVALIVDGMHCGHCVARVDKTLRGVAGVTVLTVEIGRIEVELDRPDLIGAVQAAIATAGYTARAA